MLEDQAAAGSVRLGSRPPLHHFRDGETLRAANNYAASLLLLDRFEEAKSLLRRILSVTRRVYGDNDDKSIRIKTLYAKALYRADGATLDDVRESVETFEDAERTARRLLGGAHPVVGSIELFLRNAREELAARETPSASA